MAADEGATERAGGGRLRRALRLLGQLVVVAAALYFSWLLLAGIGWQDLRQRLAQTSPGWLVVSILLLLSRFVVWDLRWRLAFERLEEVPSALHTFFVLLSAACVNLITPSARVVGGLLRARYVARVGPHSFGRVYGAVLFDQVAHQAVMLIATLLAFVGMAFVLDRLVLAVAALSLLLLAAGALAWWLHRSDRQWVARAAEFFATRAARRGGNVERVFRHGREAVAVLGILLADAPLRRLAVLFGLAYLLLNGAAQWAIFVAMGRDVGFLAVLVAVTLGFAAGAVTGTPGGLGTTEAGMILSFVALGIGRVDAAAATLVFRGLHYLMVLALGLPAILVFELGGGRGSGATPPAVEP
ncbi:MAG TPA: lysylphosphatidylglycerol synthase transmembrane domain-containing protein [Thermoanaerobaculia bacterium]|nr:lysylphosphatidylglycerol synthase transmembrane domain-containing protein [Thermoanaerobaculia bacterium]